MFLEHHLESRDSSNQSSSKDNLVILPLCYSYIVYTFLFEE